MMLDQAQSTRLKQQLPKSPNAMPLTWIEHSWYCLICLCALDGWGTGLEFWGGGRLGKKQAGVFATLLVEVSGSSDGILFRLL